MYNKVNDVTINFLGKPLRWIVLFLSTFLVVFPFYWLATSAVKLRRDYLAVPPVLLPKEITFENFERIFLRDGALNGLQNSLVVAGCTMIVAVFIGSLAAYAISKGSIPEKARHIFAFWFLIQKMYPAISVGVPVFLVMRKLGLLDTRLALIIMNTSFNIPLVIWLMLGFFGDVPAEIEESGRIDGCNLWQRYFLLAIPVVKPGLIAAAILTFIESWNEFLFAVILGLRKATTLTVLISGFITDRGLEWGPMAAMGVVIILPVAVIVWALQKNFVKGLAMGAVKE
ncbi:MAG: carbohydrate ABC transporter permease [Limnochordia bacterium]|jgi:ABC-type glycerol-3-phosphate transport system permease component|nr:MAG: sugar ABC transporter permease [Peptococcaceae bacterium 1109]